MSTFAKTKPQTRRAKVLLLGEAGTGKTHAALTFPHPAVIDAEGSADWFADRFEFSSVPTKSYTEVRDLIRQARTGQVQCETIVIDSLTSIYNGLLNAASAEREDLRPLDWGRIKRKFSQLLDELYHQLPMHVVCIGWIKPEYAKPGDRVNGNTVKANDLVKVGETFDGDRKTLYAFDFVFKIEGNDGKKTRATVIKSRSGKLAQGQSIPDFSWKTLQSLLPSNGETLYRGMTDDEQVARDRGALEREEPAEPTKTAAQLAAEKAEKAEVAMAELYDRWLKFHDGNRLAFEDAAKAAGCTNVGAVKEYVAEMERAANARPASESAVPSPADEPATSRQTAMLHALHGKLGHNDDDRHFVYDAVCGKLSIKELSKVNAQHVIDHLNAEIAKREQGAA